MRTGSAMLILTGLMLGFEVVPASGQTASLETVIDRTRDAYIRADFSALHGVLADTVVFAGDTQMFGGRGSTSGLRMTADSLVSAYETFSERVGRERLVGLLREREWQQFQSDRDGAPHPVVRAGDHLLYTHLRTSEPPTAHDELVMFVFREVRGMYRVVAHVADY